MTQSTESFIEAEAAGFTWERRAPRHEDKHVLGPTLNWLNTLPKGVRPVHLPEDFPRITNELARLWTQVPALDRYFEDKAFSPRAGRQGFPPLIVEELLAMHEHSMRSRPPTYEDRFPHQESLRD